MNQYRNLKVWQKAVALATEVYRASGSFPKEEMYGLTAQLQRSIVSIASNIAEGAGRSHEKEFAQFLSIAYGSAYETETQLLIAKNLNYLSSTEFENLEKELAEVQKMLYSLKLKLGRPTQDSRLKTQD